MALISEAPGASSTVPRWPKSSSLRASSTSTRVPGGHSASASPCPGGPGQSPGGRVEAGHGPTHRGHCAAVSQVGQVQGAVAQHSLHTSWLSSFQVPPQEQCCQYLCHRWWTSGTPIAPQEAGNPASSSAKRLVEAGKSIFQHGIHAPCHYTPTVSSQQASVSATGAADA